MLSLSALTSGSAASGYYQSEGYYIEGSEEAEAGAQYFGKAAKEAGLVGSIDDAVFADLLAGETPSGHIMGRYLEDGTRQHRHGLDLTFSAPKGVSIAGLVAGDTRVIDAHTDAVKTAMAFVEEKLVQSRTKRNGEITVETGGKIIAGLFQHDTSRALDPQLHTHAVIANMVERADGLTRALHNDKIFENTLLVGQIYRNALAQNLERLGYTIERGDKGLFDIAEVPKDLVETFSKRREQITEALASRNLEPNSKNSDLAALATRESKKPIERAELRAAWTQEAEKAGHDLGRIAPTHSPDMGDKTHAVSDAVEFALLHTAERSAVYERAEIVQFAMRRDFRATEDAVQKHIDTLIAQKVLFTVTRGEQQFLTDTQNLANERRVLNEVRIGVKTEAPDVRSLKEKAVGRSNDSSIAKRLSGTNLTDGQKDAVAISLSTEHGRFVGVQGLAGTGKTYMLRTVAQYATKAGYDVHGWAPTHKAAEALSEAIPNAGTIDAALVKAQNQGLGDTPKPRILVIDEASMVSTSTMADTLKLANDAGYARVILVGDVKQLEAVGAGSPFRLLQENGLPVATMADIQRQNTDDGRKAVLHAYKGEVREALSHISPVRETAPGEDRLERRGNIAQAIAQDYLGRDRATRDRTGIVVMTNEMRGMVNAEVQSGLRDRGDLRGDGATVPMLVPRNLSWAERRDVESYAPGDIVTTTRTMTAQGLSAGQLHTVAEADSQARVLTLTASDGSAREIGMGPDDKASTKLIAYRPGRQTVFVGDKVTFKISDRENGIVNAASGTINRASDSAITVTRETGERMTLAADSMAVKGMQLAYAATAHAFQGASIDQVLLGFDSGERMATEKAFYVSISRMRDATQIYTDSAEKMAATVLRQSGAEVNALELLDDRYRASDRSPERAPETSRSELEKPSENRRVEAETNAVQKPELVTEKQPPTLPFEAPEKPTETTPSKDPEKAPEKRAEADRENPRQEPDQADLFERLVDQLLNQKERGERER